MLVRDWMAREPLVASPETSVEEAIHIMRGHRVRHLSRGRMWLDEGGGD